MDGDASEKFGSLEPGWLPDEASKLPLQEANRLRPNAVERIEAALFDLHESRILELAKVMGHGGLLDVEMRLDVAYADVAAQAAQQVHHLQADRMADRLEHARDAVRLRRIQ